MSDRLAELLKCFSLKAHMGQSPREWLKQINYSD